MQQHQGPEAPGSPAPRRENRRLLAAGAVAGGLLLGAFGVAAAQTDPAPPTTATTRPAASAPAPGPDDPRRAGRGLKRRGPGHRGMGKMGGVVRGETVTRNGSGFRTIATQTGTVTEVSPSSVTVRSDDGFLRRYAVDENTMVNAGRDGIGDVRQGDTVRVRAVVNGDTAHAMHIDDTTNREKIRRHWAPAPPPTGTPPTTR